MNFDFSDFVAKFYDDGFSNGEFYETITNYPDYIFFIGLSDYLEKTFIQKQKSDIYISISQTYYKVKKYFKEH